MQKQALKNMTRSRQILVSVILSASVSCMAEDLGTIGPTYPIGETNFLELIKQRLQEKEKTGELKKWEEQARIRGIETVRNPKPIPGIKPTETARTFYYDPTFTLDRNVLDDRGQLLFAAGTRKNPLEVVSMSKHLLFFDARDKKQVVRAKALMTFYNGKVKPILVGGSYLALMKAWQIPVYYDQQGVLIKRFGITQVPAIVSQEGMRLRIDELELQ